MVKALKKLEHDIKDQENTLATSLHMLEQASELVEKMQKEYFQKQLTVTKIEIDASGKMQEVEFHLS
ncbi:MAG: hypothetical protein R3A45_01405 [Bdellovibrionota bacterium]